jgi:serine/threonine protein kinase
MYKHKFQKYSHKVMNGGLSCPQSIDQQYIQKMKDEIEFTGNNDIGFMRADNEGRHIITYQLNKIGEKIMLGSGGMGQVYKAQMTHFKNNIMIQHPAVIKEMDIGEEYKKNMICLELLSVFNIKHKNIIKYYGYAELNDKILVFMEFIEGKDLYYSLYDNTLLFSEKILIAKQLLSGLYYLHQNNIYHRDIKLENIMITRTDKCEIVPKYIDFNFSCINNFTCDKTLFGQGTRLYMSPELLKTLRSKNFSGLNTNMYEHHDLWALGVTLYSLLTGELLFDNEDDIIQATQNTIDDKIRTKIQYQFDLEYVRTSIFNLLKINPLERKLEFQTTTKVDYGSAYDIV